MMYSIEEIHTMLKEKDGISKEMMRLVIESFEKRGDMEMVNITKKIFPEI